MLIELVELHVATNINSSLREYNITVRFASTELAMFNSGPRRSEITSSTGFTPLHYYSQYGMYSSKYKSVKHNTTIKNEKLLIAFSKATSSTGSESTGLYIVLSYNTTS